MTTRTTTDAENQLRTDLARADLDDATIAHWLTILRPRLDSAGRYRRSTGECIGTDQLAALVLASEQAKHTQTAEDAPETTIPTGADLVALQARLKAERERQAAGAPHTVAGLLRRMENPLDRIKP